MACRFLVVNRMSVTLFCCGILKAICACIHNITSTSGWIYPYTMKIAAAFALNGPILCCRITKWRTSKAFVRLMTSGLIGLWNWCGILPDKKKFCSLSVAEIRLAMIEGPRTPPSLTRRSLDLVCSLHIHDKKVHCYFHFFSKSKY